MSHARIVRAYLVDDANGRSILRDGRHRRGLATRTKVIAACRLLMRNGSLRPTFSDVAACSGVTVRTIFNHFENARTLYACALDDHELTALILDRLPVGREDLFRLILLYDHIPSSHRQRVAPAMDQCSADGRFDHSLT